MASILGLASRRTLLQPSSTRQALTKIRHFSDGGGSSGGGSASTVKQLATFAVAGVTAYGIVHLMQNGFDFGGDDTPVEVRADGSGKICTVCFCMLKHIGAQVYHPLY
mmetsp:Transcript_44562/g.67180  ORF Transcript_44562/g.67180 Transcript_44562/m.67180 type:complete len:108 (+) Transcript_44562:53-376(+)